MTLDPNTFDYLKPTDEQMKTMNEAREAAHQYASTLEALLPAGPDKDHALRILRTVAMWANISITRLPDGQPRP